MMNSVKLYNKMDTIFVNSENSKISDLHRLLLNLSDKIYLKRRSKYVALSNFITQYIWKYIKKVIKKNEFKISTPSWNYKFELTDGYSVSDIQYYVEYIIEKHRVVTDNPLIKIYVNKVENRS